MSQPPAYGQSDQYGQAPGQYPAVPPYGGPAKPEQGSYDQPSNISVSGGAHDQTAPPDNSYAQQPGPADNGHGDAYAQKRPREDDYGPNKRAATDDYYAQGHGRGDTVFRMLCPLSVIGSIIGTKGATIKQIEDGSGARVQCVKDFPRGCDEKVIVISSPPVSLPGQELNAAQVAVFDIFERMMAFEHGNPNPHFRMLICQTQAGSLIGKSGAVIKEMKERSGCTQIKVLQPDNLPLCGLANDKLVHVTGTVESLRIVLRQTTDRLRDSPPKERPSHDPPSNAFAAPGMGAPPGPDMGPGGMHGPPGGHRPMGPGMHGPPGYHPHGGGPPMRPY